VLALAKQQHDIRARMADEAVRCYPKKVTARDGLVFQAVGGKLALTLMGFCQWQPFQLGYVTALWSLGFFPFFFFLRFFFCVWSVYIGAGESDEPFWMKETLLGMGVTESKGEGGEPTPKPTSNLERPLALW